MTYVQPFFALLLLIHLVQVLWRRRRFQSSVLVFSAAVLALFCWPPLAWLGARFLQGPHPNQPWPASEAQAIVVLAGTVHPPEPERPIPLLGLDSYERCRYAAWLRKNWRTVPILVCGGGDTEEAPPYAASMRDALQSEGVPASAIWVEDRSRSTYENALFGAEILRKNSIRKIALVTDGYHMPRAVRCFRKQGLDVAPAPVGFREFYFHPSMLLPGWEAVSWNEDTMHELLGLVWYGIRGWV